MHVAEIMGGDPEVSGGYETLPSIADKVAWLAVDAVGGAPRAPRLETDVSWRESAECLGVDPDLFFPERGESAAPAKEVCCRCNVQDDCLKYALGNGIVSGVWGGKSERQRRKIRREQATERDAGSSGTD